MIAVFLHGLAVATKCACPASNIAATIERHKEQLTQTATEAGGRNRILSQQVFTGVDAIFQDVTQRLLALRGACDETCALLDARSLSWEHVQPPRWGQFGRAGIYDLLLASE